jgi:2-polyprenyl-6-methoxyphenol hydroxylase-like FAD-dependent oxidoreductase
MEQNTAKYTKSALVIGAGIAGPVAAMALQKAGIEATVYEAHESTAEGVGGGMSIAPNGIEALASIALDHVVRPLGVPMTGIEIQDWSGRPLGLFANPPGVAPMQFLWRGDLYRALYDEALRRGILIEHGKRLMRTEEKDDGVTAHFDDGTEATAEVLIGADGIRSTVRGLLDASAPGPEYAGLISFGAKISKPGVPSTRGKMPMSFGKRAFFGYQIFDDDTAMWFANLPQREPMTLADVLKKPAAEWLPYVRAQFVTDGTPAVRLIDRTEPDELIIVGPVEFMPPTTAVWSRGRVVLIGDAVHAPSSSSGQGASLSIESAIQLARCLRDLPYDQAFATYEAERRPRVEKVIKETTRKNARKAAGPVARVLNAWAIKLFSKINNPAKMAWIFDYRIDWDAKVSAHTS